MIALIARVKFNNQFIIQKCSLASLIGTKSIINYIKKNQNGSKVKNLNKYLYNLFISKSRIYLNIALHLPNT